MISDQVSIPVVGLFILLAAYIAHSKLTSTVELSKQIPWVGRGDGFFSGLRARINSLRSSALEISDAGYKKVGLCLNTKVQS